MRIQTFALCVFLLVPWVAVAGHSGVGDSIESFELEDQHGVLRRVDAETVVILFSRDMDGGDILKSALADLPEGTLASLKAAYIADISGMPRLVARLFAIPSMRKRPYPMLLDRDGETTVQLPDVEGRATLIFLDRLKIVRLVHADEAEDVRAALSLPDSSDGDESDADR